MIRIETRKTAILVDGGFYRERAALFWGKEKTPQERADELFSYCMIHLKKSDEPRDLYRIFYYDCPGMTRELIHPLTGETVNFAIKSTTQWIKDFFDALARKRKVALRLGELAESQAQYTLKPDTLYALLSKELTMDDLTRRHFKLDVKQKGVDMRIGLDVASLFYGHYVNQIILITGDSDFVPVAKMARRHGIDFILDPMGQYIKPGLSEHIDGIETFTADMPRG